VSEPPLDPPDPDDLGRCACGRRAVALVEGEPVCKRCADPDPYELWEE
jgi:hypothetical protein